MPRQTLQEAFPEIAAQWHSTRNGNLTPDMVAPNSKKKVWWLFPYDDPETKKHYNFEWKTSVRCRTNPKSGCPFISGRAVWSGFNDLRTRFPEIASQWHHSKNGDLTPDKVTASSGKKVWWLLKYYDPITGKQFVFEWKASVASRTKSKNGCPFLSGRAVWSGFNDLRTQFPEIAAQWHPTKNGDLLPNAVTAFSNKTVWWKLEYDDPITGNCFEFEWQAAIVWRTKQGHGCPFLSGDRVWPGFNDLQTLFPQIAKQWHPYKNGDVLPSEVTAGSKKRVWWLYVYDDPKTGQHFDFEWMATVGSRAYGGNGCPFIHGLAVWPGYNDLKTLNPELASQWHPSKNGELTPDMVTRFCNKKVWWLYNYFDEKTGKEYAFEWQARVLNRYNSGTVCPFFDGP